MFRQVLSKYLQHNRAKMVTYEFKLTKISNFNKPSCCCTNYIHTRNITYKYKHASETSSKLNEKEFLVKLQNDPDVFGHGIEIESNVDPGDIQEETFLSDKPHRSQKLSTKEYADIIKSHLRKRQIKEAIDVLEIRMLQYDRVKPENYIYNLVIGGCSKVGYTKKAFSLYNEMKRGGLQVTPGTYTALFNACANSPWLTTDGLTRARHLRNIMIEKMYEPNLTNYNAMIKAFGRCGDLETAFSLVDEMAAKKFVIQDDTLNFLLQACISDKEAGFRHALLVWRKFIQKKITPSLFSYNLLLRCIRDCELGDLDVTNDVIERILSGSTNSQKLLNESGRMLVDYDANKLTIIKDDLEKHINDDGQDSLIPNKPNLMAKIPHLGSILSLTEVKKPEHRLLLVGGASEFLQNMADNNVTPDIKTYTQLLDNIPSTTIAEKELLRSLRKNKIKPDIDFFNMLIKKRSVRFEYESAREVLTMLNTANLQPNLITYGILALGCKRKEDGLSLLNEMYKANYRMNIEILGAMLTQACYHNNFSYVIQLMEICVSEEIPVSTKFLENLENFKKKSKHISNDMSNPLAKSALYQKGYKLFKTTYKPWLEKIQVEDQDGVHPWQQYRQTSDTDVKHYQDKEAQARFKPVHTSFFKQKKVEVKNNKIKRKFKT